MKGGANNSINTINNKIMEQMTVRINGEECVILPAPKGAFVISDHFACPCFVPYVAVSAEAESRISEIETLDIYALSYSDGAEYVEWNARDGFCTSVSKYNLDDLYHNCIKCSYEPKRALTMLYQEFKSHGTPFDYSAIKWFKEKFKEHNITKADFDVFA